MSLELLALKSAPFDLKYGFAAFPLIGTRAAPANGSHYAAFRAKPCPGAAQQT
jgi:hypothetical protein